MKRKPCTELRGLLRAPIRSLSSPIRGNNSVRGAGNVGGRCTCVFCGSVFCRRKDLKLHFRDCRKKEGYGSDHKPTMEIGHNADKNVYMYNIGKEKIGVKENVDRKVNGSKNGNENETINKRARKIEYKNLKPNKRDDEVYKGRELPDAKKVTESKVTVQENDFMAFECPIYKYVNRQEASKAVNEPVTESDREVNTDDKSVRFVSRFQANRDIEDTKRGAVSNIRGKVAERESVTYTKTDCTVTTEKLPDIGMGVSKTLPINQIVLNVLKQEQKELLNGLDSPAKMNRRQKIAKEYGELLPPRLHQEPGCSPRRHKGHCGLTPAFKCLKMDHVKGDVVKKRLKLVDDMVGTVTRGMGEGAENITPVKVNGADDLVTSHVVNVNSADYLGNVDYIDKQGNFNNDVTSTETECNGGRGVSETGSLDDVPEQKVQGIKVRVSRCVSVPGANKQYVKSVISGMRNQLLSLR